MIKEISPEPFKVQTTPDYLFKNTLLKSTSWRTYGFQNQMFKNLKTEGRKKPKSELLILDFMASNITISKSSIVLFINDF